MMFNFLRRPPSALEEEQSSPSPQQHISVIDVTTHPLFSMMVPNSAWILRRIDAAIFSSGRDGM
jgi:hypothetical protein